MGAAFGGGNSAGVFGATGATSFLGKTTYVMAFLFMLSSILLVREQGSTVDRGIGTRLEQRDATPETLPVPETITPEVVPNNTTTPETEKETSEPK